MGSKVSSASSAGGDSILYGDAPLLHRQPDWRPGEINPMMLGSLSFERAVYDQEEWIGSETWVAKTGSLPKKYKHGEQTEQVPQLMRTLIKRLVLDAEVTGLGVEPAWQVPVELQADEEDQGVVWVRPRERLRCILDAEAAIDLNGLPGDAHPMALIEELFADQDLDDTPEWVGVEQLMLGGGYFFGMLYLAGSEPLGCVTIIGNTSDDAERSQTDKDAS